MEVTYTKPLLPLRDIVIFPSISSHIDKERERERILERKNVKT